MHVKWWLVLGSVAVASFFAVSALAVGGKAKAAKAPPTKEGRPLAIARAAFEPRQERFESHATHLALKTPFEPLRPLRQKLESRIGRRLLNRGEAHVTVITPPEFDVLRTHLSMHEIEKLAGVGRAPGELQEATRLEPVCLGRGEAMLDGQLEQTYFIVVKSDELVALRQKILALFVERGGEAGRFAPEAFFPHVTIGFSKIDLHEHHGVRKGADSCVYPLVVSTKK